VVDSLLALVGVVQAANPRRAVESLLSTAATAAEEDDVRYGRTKVFLAEPVHKYARRKSKPWLHAGAAC